MTVHLCPRLPLFVGITHADSGCLDLAARQLLLVLIW